MNATFHNLFVFGRPAGGKSEFIDFMKRTEPLRRRELFHIAPFEVIDDFQFLCHLAEAEDQGEKQGLPRKMTRRTPDGVVVTDERFFDWVGEKINSVYLQKYAQSFHDERTLLVEFSRGVGTAGYGHSLKALSDAILSRGAILYIQTSYAEALRRNEARYQEKLKHSILAHKVPVEAMERFYQEDDWSELTQAQSSGFISVRNLKIPFVTMDNERESLDPVVLQERYSQALQQIIQP